MARSVQSFERRGRRYKPQPLSLIVCEDSTSCLNYLGDVSRHFRSFAQVEISHGGMTDPLGIVKHAASRKRSFDKVFCAIDRDSHANFDDAIQLSRQVGVEVIASYPCYEYWLLLHFTRSRAPFASTDRYSAGELAVRELRKHDQMADYAKGSSKRVFDLLLPRLGNAWQTPCTCCNREWTTGTSIQAQGFTC